MFQPFNTANPHSLPSVVSGVSTLTQKVLAIFRKYGSDAHVYMPGPGIPILGPELIANGNLTTGIAGWSAARGATISHAGGSLIVDTPNPANWAAGVAELQTTVGKTYSVSALVVRVSGPESAQLVKSDSASVHTNTVNSIVSASSAQVSFNFSATSTITYLHCGAAGNSASLNSYSFDNISVKELLGYSNSFNGLTAGNYLDSVGTTYGAVDGLVGLTLDGAGKVGPELMNSPTWSNGFNTNGAKQTPLSWVEYTPLNVSSSTTVSGSYSFTGTAHLSGIECNAIQSSHAGKLIKVTIRARKTAQVSGSTTLQVLANGSWFEVVPTTHAIGAWITKTLIVPNSSQLIISNFNGAASWEISEFSVCQVTGVHATQVTTGYKPYLRRGLMNLLTYSNDFSNAAWSKPGATIGTTTGPDGSPAAAITVPAAGVSTTVYHSSIAATSTTMSYVAYVKGVVSESRSFLMRNSTTATSFDALQINLVTGVVTAGAAFWGVTALPDGWYKLTYTRSTGITVGDGISVYGGFTGSDSVATGHLLTVANTGLFAGSVVPDEIPVTTSAPASSSIGSHFWQFDGVDDRLTLNSIPFQMTDDYTMCTGTQINVSLGYGSILAFTDGNSGNYVTLLSSLGRPAIEHASSGGYAGVTHSTSLAGTRAVVSGRKLTNTLSLRINGAASGTPANTSVVTPFTLSMGAIGAKLYSGSAGGYNLNPIYAVVVIKGTVSDADLLAIEKWVGKLSGVAI